MSGMTTYAQGTLIWIKHDEEVWMQAEIVTANEKEIIVKTAEEPDGRIILAPNEPIFLRTTDVFTTEGLSVMDDLTQLDHLHEPAVLSSLQNRFDVDKIYTFTGPILIALNPFKVIPGLYDDEVLKSFISTKPSTKPHVFNTSNMAYRGICDRQKSQTVLISGESGAGKTETTKFVMKFLAVAGSTDGGVTDVEKQVLESNPLLEAFGNARTLRNDNSSRFGKFIELQFRSDARKGAGSLGVAEGGHARLCGARIQTYLLEKVRVCDQQEGERNYHIFYEACAAAATLAAGAHEYSFPQVIAKAKVKEEMVVSLEGFADLGNFAYTTRSTCKTLKDVNDVELFERRIQAMQTIGISKDNMAQVLSVIAAVLNLGNAKFDAPPNNSEGSMVMQECSSTVELVAKLLSVTRKDLESALCNTTRVTRSEKIRSPVNVRQASDNRDALAKALYGIIFNFIVAQTNISIGYANDVRLFAGVLDIFGFECFKMNSFEQLCINFTNERLQQFFNSFVFKLEEQLYEREGIPWDALDFPDNQDSVDILQAKSTGIFAILDEECVVPQGSDQGFCNKIIKQHKGHRRFDEIKTKPTWFVIKHFAGPVSYCSDSFLDKNKDQLSNDLIECMGGSKNEFIAGLFKKDPKYADVLGTGEEKEQKAGGKKKKYTVSSEFKDQLASLMDIVDLTEPHFIRCIKPNPQNEHDRYDRKAVTEQLRYGGVLQVVQVSRAGYPVRINHQECWDDYKIIASPTVVAGLKHIDDGKIRAQKLLEHLTTELNIPKPAHGLSWAVGKTLVFFKLPAFERIKFARLELLVKSTTRIQADWRRKVRRTLYKAILVFTKHVQAMLRTKQARAELELLRNERAATKIQALALMASCRRSYKADCKKVVRIQAWRQGILGRIKAKEQRRFVCAQKIQRRWRRWKEQKIYKVLMHAIHIAQDRWRMHYAKQQMKKLKQEAKEVGALMAKNQKAQEQATELRKKNEEMEAVMLQLQSEKKSIQSKVKQMEDSLAELKQQVEDIRKESEEATRQTSEAMSTAVSSEAIDEMKQTLEDKDKEAGSLREEIDSIKEATEKTKQDHQKTDMRYQQLLRQTTLESTANFPKTAAAAGGAGAGAAAGPGAIRVSTGAGPSARLTGKLASANNRNVFIQLVGMQSVGKTCLLETLIQEWDPQQLPKFVEQRPNLMTHHQIQIGDRLLKLLDCSGNVRAQHLVKEWFARSIWVCVVYDVANAKSLEYALDLAKEVEKNGAKLILFGNKHAMDHGKPAAVDVSLAKDCAARSSGLAIESSQLIDVVKMALSETDQGSDQTDPQGRAPGPGGLPGGVDSVSPENRKSSISQAIDSVKSWFGADGRTGNRSASQGVLRPSLKAPKASRMHRREGDINTELRAVTELQDTESAVTCITFGQERLHRNYILLATASKDGSVTIYRCHRTQMELEYLGDMEFPPEDDPNNEVSPVEDQGQSITVHTRLVGHARAITSCFFNMLEEQLVTTSIDKSVRFWGIETGEILKVFTDSSPVPVALFLPFNPQVFVAANSNAVLRLVNVLNGMVLQKLKVETEVRALTFDDTGSFLLAGTKSGSIHVLEASDSNTLKFKFKVQLARGGVTCICFVPANMGQPACLLVNTSDSSATIIDCTYGPPAGHLTNLAVRHRVRVAHSLLPLKCCYSPSGPGYLISGSEDKEVYVFALHKGNDQKVQYLKHHTVPVVAVAVNAQDTLLASADSLGRIAMWRRMDFSGPTD